MKVITMAAGVCKRLLIAALLFGFPVVVYALDLGPNLSLTADADSDGYHNLARVRDGNLGSAPTAYAGYGYPKRIAIKWGQSRAFNTIILREQGSNVTSWQLEIHDTNIVLASGTSIGPELIIPVGEVSARKVNLHILSADNTPAIAEFEIYNAAISSDPQEPGFIKGKVTDVFIKADTGIVQANIATLGSPSLPPSCANSLNRYGIVYQSEASKAIYSLLLSAQISGGVIKISGTGECLSNTSLQEIQAVGIGD